MQNEWNALEIFKNCVYNEQHYEKKAVPNMIDFKSIHAVDPELCAAMRDEL